jgi:malate synthase
MARSDADAATEAQAPDICRRQVWEWLHPPRVLKDGRALSALLFEAILADEMAMLRETIGAETFDSGGFENARTELLDIARSDLPPH